MKSPDVRSTSPLLLLLLAPAALLFAAGCQDECTDAFDCREEASEGVAQVCRDGRCVPDEVIDEDGGEGADAGEGSDGGGTDAGETPDGGGGALDGGEIDGGQPDSGQPGPTALTARLTSEQFVPPASATTGTATGTFALSPALSDGGHALTYSVTLNGINGNLADQAHLHVAPAGVNGPIAVTLNVGPISGTTTITPALAGDLLGGRVYVDIHSTGGPGADVVRGQLIHPGERLFVARLTGSEAGNALVTCNNASFGGTANASACGAVQVVLTSDAQSLKYTGRWDPQVVMTGSHIHEGGPGQSGGVLVTFDALADGGFGVEGGPTALNGVDAGALDGGYYVNVHTADAGNGLIRGQLYER